MPVALPAHAEIVALSADIFGPDRLSIVGRIEDCTFGLEINLGRVLVTDRLEAIYMHPTLFSDLSLVEGTGGWVEVRQARDPAWLVMRPYCLRGRRVPSGNTRQAEAAAAPFGKIAVADVVQLYRSIERFGGFCANPSCTGAKERALDPRRTVLVKPIPLCAHCFKKECVRIPGLQERVVFDGRQLPPP